MKISQLGEFRLIARLSKFVPTSRSVVLGIGDDAAVLPYTKDKYLLFTTDMLADKVHFTLTMNPVQIGHKALACNISDIAAMGGVPIYAVISIGLPKDTPVAYIEKIYKGIGQTAKEYGVSIVGGDSIKSNTLTINVALLGVVKKKHLVTRAGAKPKDWVFVTGPLGGSFKSDRHLTFEPCVEASSFIVRNFKPSAMIDISDGLAGDLNHILEKSNVGAKLWPESVPLHHGANLGNALNDGEDYALLFTLDPKMATKLMHWQFKKKVCHFYPIGEITADKKQRIHAKSFTHY